MKFSEEAKAYIDEFMSTLYVRGYFVSKNEASISVLDRGFLFGESVYELIPIYDGVSFLFDQHITRLNIGIKKLGFKRPTENWKKVLEELIKRNRSGDCVLYIQISQGQDFIRNHLFDNEPVTPTVVAFLQPTRIATFEKKSEGYAAITSQDVRQVDCSLKVTNLLNNVFFRQKANEINAIETIFVRENIVLEGTTTNIFVVKNGKVKTPKLDGSILPGITRAFVINLCANEGIHLKEATISEEELKQADEIWLTSSSKEIIPVVKLNGSQVGNGLAGPVWEKIYSQFLKVRPIPNQNYPKWSAI